MKDFDLDIIELHAAQYRILEEFDRVCKKYNLTYCLAYGTLLGAIRHNGFIPWDDDIDTLMPYQDYQKLMAIPQSEWGERFFLQTSETDPNARFCFAKLRDSNTTLITEGLAHLDINQGVDIDIYPLVKLAENTKKRRKQYKNTMAYMLLQVNEAPRNHGTIYYVLGKTILSVIPSCLKNKLIKSLLKKITAYEEENTSKCYVINGNLEIMKQALETAWFSKTIEHRFENKEFPIPIGATSWLKARYGENYMELPPEEKRGIKLDTFVYVDLNHSYTKYKGIYYCVPNSKRKKVLDNRWVGKDS